MTKARAIRDDLFVEGPPPRLPGSRCRETGEVFYPAQVMNPVTHRAGTVERVELSGEGTLLNFSKVSRPFPVLNLPMPLASSSFRPAHADRLAGCKPPHPPTVATQFRHLDVAMSENLLPFMYWALASGFVGQWPRPGAELITGRTARYRIYRTKDGRFLAAAPIESQFWSHFCAIVGIPTIADAATVEVAISGRTADEWRKAFAGEDVCCPIVSSLADAVKDPHVVARNIFSQTVESRGKSIPALPLPLVPPYRDPVALKEAPTL